MTDDVTTMVRELYAKQGIWEQIVTYCRAVDRLDRELLLSVYHSDAIDDHGMFVGSPDDFADWAFALHAQAQYRTQHIVNNFRCELDGKVAHTETYYLFVGCNRAGPPLTLSGGRYLDRFEERERRWKISQRKCVPEWRGVPGESWLSPEAIAALTSAGGVSRDRTDVSYERPLAVDPARIGFVYRESIER